MESATNSWDVALLNSDRNSNEDGMSSDGSDKKTRIDGDQLHNDISEELEKGAEDPEITEGNTEQDQDKSDNTETPEYDEIVDLVRNSKVSQMQFILLCFNFF
ncbi:unnamed protein product [Onchocerca flexuosa]|uniref:CTNNB1_binding domain-containing protein n=1 Tax=Onchocerca flexuosa TaxID=387005 RepID=A0A183HG02_9BILA|nr:unnamed protein product [Onchocerca flexuosa]